MPENLNTHTQATIILKNAADVYSKEEMKNARIFLRFAVRLPQIDFDMLRPGDWLNVRQEFEALFSGDTADRVFSPGSGMIAQPIVAPLPAAFTTQDFQDLQRETHVMLSRRVQGQCMSMPCQTMWHIFIGSRFWMVFKDTTAACFLSLLFMLLAREPVDRIQTCPECGVFFYRMNRQNHCSRRCMNRVTQRRWRTHRDEKVSLTHAG